MGAEVEVPCTGRAQHVTEGLARTSSGSAGETAADTAWIINGDQPSLAGVGSPAMSSSPTSAHESAAFVACRDKDTQSFDSDSGSCDKTLAFGLCRRKREACGRDAGQL